jgi:hypothetical protein
MSVSQRSLMAYYLKVSKPSYFLFLPARTIGESTHVDFWKADRTAVRPINLEDSIVNMCIRNRLATNGEEGERLAEEV